MEMTTLSELNVRLGLETSELNRGVRRVSDTMQGLGEKMKSIGSKMSTNISLPLAGAAGAAMASAGDMESANRQIQNQLGLTAKQAEKLEGVAVSVWKNGFGDSMSGVADTVAKVRQNMGDLGADEIQKVTEKALGLEQSLEIGVGESTKAARTLMKNFGISSSEAFDTIATGVQNGLNYSDDFLDTLNEYAPQFSALGMSSEDFINKLAAGSESGAFSIDKIADAVKEFNIRAKDGSKTTSEAFGQLGLDADAMSEKFAGGGEKAKKAFETVVQKISGIKDPIKRNEAAVALFGTQFEDLEANVIKSLGSTENQLKVVEGAAGQVSENMKNSFGAEMKETFRGLQEAMAPLGRILLDMLQSVTPKIKVFSEWLSGLSPVGQKVAVVVGLITAAIGPLLMMAGSFMSAIGPLAPHLAKILMPALTGVRTALMALTGPIGIAIAIITLLGTIIYKNWDAIAAKTSEIWTAVTTWIGNAAQNIKNAASQKFNEMRQRLGEIMGSAKDRISNIVTGMKDFFVNKFQSLKDNVSSITSGVKNFVSSTISKMKSVVLGTVSELVARVKNFFSNLKRGLSSIFSGIFSIASDSFGKVKSTVSNLASSAKDAVTDKFSSMKGAVSDKMNAIKSSISNIWGKVESFFSGIDLVGVGKDIMRGLGDGIKSMAGDLKRKAQEIASGIKDKITGFFSIHSPSRVMRDEVGKNIGAGIMVGMDSMKRKVAGSATNLANASMPQLNSIAVGSNVQGVMVSGGDGGGNTYNYYATIDASKVKDFNDVVELFKKLPQAVRAN